MTISYTWDVYELQIRSKDGIDTLRVYWKKTGSDGDAVGYFATPTDFDYETGSMKPLVEFTESELIEMVQAKLTEQQVEAIDKSIAAQIDNQLHPFVPQQLPWVTE